VQATIDTPKSHHGILRPERKNDSAFAEDLRIPAMPMPITTTRKATMIAISIGELTIDANIKPPYNVVDLVLL
jgi:hypothetical protein